jgi:restriction endonuclease Mrr
MTPIQFKPYGINQAAPTVIAERISHWHQIDYNGHYGTEIVLDTGATIRVGEWTNQVEDALCKALASPVVEAAPPSPEAALEGMVDALTKALDEAPLNDVLSTATAMFVTLITDVCKHKGHDESLPITVDGGDNRDITIHPLKKQGAL